MKTAIRHGTTSAFSLPNVNASRAHTDSDTVRTGLSAKSLKLFAGIHESKNFTADTAFKHFAGVKRSK